MLERRGEEGVILKLFCQGLFQLTMGVWKEADRQT